jgi:hypothetical protein
MLECPPRVNGIARNQPQVSMLNYINKCGDVFQSKGIASVATGSSALFPQRRCQATRLSAAFGANTVNGLPKSYGLCSFGALANHGGHRFLLCGRDHYAQVIVSAEPISLNENATNSHCAPQQDIRMFLRATDTTATLQSVSYR